MKKLPWGFAALIAAWLTPAAAQTPKPKPAFPGQTGRLTPKQ